MKGWLNRRWVPVLAGLLGLSALAGFSTPAVAGNVSDCGDFSASADTRFDIVANIHTSIHSGTCLTFPRGSVIFLNGYIIAGFDQNEPTIGISVPSDAFIWGPGAVRRFGVAISGGSDVAVEGVLVGPAHIGIRLGDSYKVKEVRVRNCVTSGGDDIGIRLGQGGFIESSIVRDCATGVLTETNNKIWNLVVSKHLITGLQLGLTSASGFGSTAGGAGANGSITGGSGAGNAVSRTVISSPKSTNTVGLDYRGCGNTGSPSTGGGCQDGSNSVQDHCTSAGLGGNCSTSGSYANNILVGGVSTATVNVVTDTATNCGGGVVPHSTGPTITGGLISHDC
ncbi:MAG: hypothetical protein KGL31_04915 [candidate division NC10 bacterium]|nr:hypothetical protein [candidate division NC10 bacterium]MDE2321244.1 hypothetical protein [candidate division NC10 bacterium]